jgi:hypothetical protein
MLGYGVLDVAGNRTMSDDAPQVTPVLALRVPADLSEPVSLVAVELAEGALSEEIGGGPLDNSILGEVGGVGFTIYVQRVAKGLPGNERAAVLSARLGEVDRAWLAELRGVALVLGCDRRFDDTDVPGGGGCGGVPGRVVVRDGGRAVTRPVVAGYVAVPAQASADSVEDLVVEWRESFAASAWREGYSLGSVFSDARGREERGLYGLALYLRRDGVVGVVVPDVGHLMHVRELAGANWRTAQRYLRSAVLPVDAMSGGSCGGRG